MLQLAILIIIVLLLIYIFTKKEKFISYTAAYSEYGPQPIAILTKFISKKMDYYELEKNTDYLFVMEIFSDFRYKIYADDHFVYEGYLNADQQKITTNLLDIADEYDNKIFCPAKDGFTQYKLWLNGRNIYLGLFGPECAPALQPAKKLFNLMESIYTQN